MEQTERTPHHFEEIGGVVASLHTHSQSWMPPPGFERPSANAEGLTSSPETDGSVWKRLPLEVRRDLGAARNRLLDIETQLGRDTDKFGLIHGDLSFGNVLFQSGRAMPIDFDDCGFGHYLYDLAVILAGPWQRPGFEDRREALLRGYRDGLVLSDDLASLLPVFMAARATAMALWDAGRAPDHSVQDAVEGQWQRVRSLLEYTQ